MANLLSPLPDHGPIDDGGLALVARTSAIARRCRSGVYSPFLLRVLLALGVGVATAALL